MSAMFEVYYRSPTNATRERELASIIEPLGGRLDYREADERSSGPIVLTYEFADRNQAEEAARMHRARGEHVEGPQDYAV